MECYSRIHNYQLRLLKIDDFPQCKQNSVVFFRYFKLAYFYFQTYFRRHCIVSEVVHETELTFYSDADVGVVNPRK